MSERRTLPLHYRVLAWALLPMLAFNGFALIHTSLSIEQARADLEARTAASEARIQREFTKRLDTLGQVAALLADSEEVAAAVVEHRGDWLYQWSHRFIGAGLSERITVADAEGIVVARGHDEFAFGDSVAATLPFRAAVERGGFTGILELDSIPSLVAIQPIYRFDTLFTGALIVSRGISLGLLGEIEQAAGGRLGVEHAGRRIGHFPGPADRGDRLTNRFALHPSTPTRPPHPSSASGPGDDAGFAEAPLWITHTRDLRQRVGVLQQLGDHLLLFGIGAIVLVVPLVVISMRRLLHPLRLLHERLEHFSRREMDLDDLIDGVAPLQRTGGEIGAIATSVTEGLRELSRTQGELRESERRAQSASRAKSEFLANMSHEIRTPINAVIGFTELLERSELDPRQLEYLKSVKSGGASLLTLINDILDLSKIEAGAMRLEYVPVSLQGLFGEIERVFRRRIEEKRLSLIVDLDPHTPAGLLIDEVRLRQVLLNLVGNAVKFTDFGSIQLSARVKRSAEARVELRIVVADTGIGIPSTSREKVFEAFEQSEDHSTRRYGGTGLGLAISRKLVEMMDGTLTLESSDGKGSAFIVNLHEVATLDHHPDGETPRERPETLRLEPCTILVVDDIPSNRALLRAVLEDCGAKVVTANDGREALERAEAIDPALILMDLKMPVMDGYEATRGIRARPALAAIPVVAVTASVTEREQARIQRAGFDGQLHKPLNRGALHQVLRRHLDHRSEPPPADIDRPPPFSLSAENRRRLPELLAALEQLQSERIAQGGGGSLSRLRDFSTRLGGLAEEHPIEPLRAYADRLGDAVEGFDIERIERELSRLPQLIGELRANGTHHEPPGSSVTPQRSTG